jgi:hypothetical protein
MGVDTVQLLFDLQEMIREIPPGEFSNPLMYANSSQNTKTILSVAEQNGEKTVCVSNRADSSDGLLLNIAEITDIQAGDRITVTGRIGEGAPKNNWGMVLHRTGENFAHLVQQRAPSTDELFYLTYLLDEIDLNVEFQVRTSHWGTETAHMDFFVDDILITRCVKGTAADIDPRNTVYSLSEDEFFKQNLKPGEMTTYLQTSGEPEYVLDNHSKSIHIKRRVNDWDGLDILLSPMKLLPGNNYSLQVTGRITGEVPQNTELMFQILPGYVWRSNKKMTANQDFVLFHLLSKTEITNAEVIRITTNTEGAKMPFLITGIDLKVGGAEGA